MAKTKTINDLSDADLLTTLAETREELFNLRFQIVTGQLDNSARIGQVKKQVARLLTELRAREIAAAEAAGLQQLHLLIAREPRDLAESGWVLRKQSWARRLGADSSAAAWGPPRCASDALRCDAAYGMTEVIKVTNVMSAPQVPASTEKPHTAATNKPTQPGRGEPVATRREPPSTEGKPRPPRNAECVEALRRASLGDASPELIEKLKSPDCR